MEGWNPFKKKGVKETIALTGVAVAGVAVGTTTEGMSPKPNTPAEAVSTMPAAHIDPTAGKSSDSAPDAIYVDPPHEAAQDNDAAGASLL